MKRKLSVLIVFLLSMISVFSEEVWNGVVHLENSNLLSHKAIVLDGNWEFYPAQEFESFNQELYDVSYIKIPGTWEKESNENIKSEIACFRIKIIGLKPLTKYAIFSRKSPATAAKFFCNGKKIASYGNYSSKKETAKNADMPVYAFMDSDLIGSIELVVQVSSYDNYESGIVAPILFGESKVISTHFTIIMLLTMLIVGGLFFTSIVNLATFIGDRSKKIHFAFFFLLTGIWLYLLCANGNLLTWLFPNLPYTIGNGLQVLALWLSPQLFCVVMMEDKVFTAKFPYLDKILFAFFSAFGIIFIFFPVVYTNKLIPVIWISNFIFFVYALYRMGRCFVTKQIIISIYIAFYIWLAIGFFLDHLFPNLVLKSIIMFTQVADTILLIFNIFFMSAIHYKVYQTEDNKKEKLKQLGFRFEKFISNEYLDFISDDNHEAVISGTHKKIASTIMTIDIAVLCSDGRKLHPREEFESYSSFMKVVCESIKKNNGIFSGFVGMGCVAIFNDSSEDALKCATEIVRLVGLVNKVRVNMAEPCAMVSCGIHYGQIIAGVIGENDQLTEAIIGSGISVANKIKKMSNKFGRPVLVSKAVVDRINNTAECKLVNFQYPEGSSVKDDLQLYECYAESEDTQE